MGKKKSSYTDYLYSFKYPIVLGEIGLDEGRQLCLPISTVPHGPLQMFHDLVLAHSLDIGNLVYNLSDGLTAHVSSSNGPHCSGTAVFPAAFFIANILS